MAEDRARDSRRVFQNPISHVKVRPQSARFTEEDDGVPYTEIDLKGADRPKYDAFGKTDSERRGESAVKAANIEWNTQTARQGRGGVWPRPASKVPVVKVKS